MAHPQQSLTRRIAAIAVIGGMLSLTGVAVASPASAATTKASSVHPNKYPPCGGLPAGSCP